MPAVDVKIAQLAPPSIRSLMLDPEFGRSLTAEFVIAVAASVDVWAVRATLRSPMSAASYSPASSFAAAALFLVLGQKAVLCCPFVLQVVTRRFAMTLCSGMILPVPEVVLLAVVAAGARGGLACCGFGRVVSTRVGGSLVVAPQLAL